MRESKSSEKVERESRVIKWSEQVECECKWKYRESWASK